MVFDRGGWCIEFLQKLDQALVYWVTWLELTRATQDWGDQLPDETFDLYTIQLNTPETKVWLAEVGVYIPSYGFCRAVVLDDREHHRRRVLGSNDPDRPLTELAQVAPDDPLVDNPQIETLRKEKSHLQARLERLQGQLGANLLKRKRNTIELAHYKAQHDQLIQDIATLEHQVEALKIQLKMIPSLPL